MIDGNESVRSRSIKIFDDINSFDNDSSSNEFAFEQYDDDDDMSYGS
jgi:hypothetical protein